MFANHFYGVFLLPSFESDNNSNKMLDFSTNVCKQPQHYHGSMKTSISFEYLYFNLRSCSIVKDVTNVIEYVG